MRVVFMGTPDFAVPVLEALIGAHQVIGVVTQPDKRKGRGKAVQFPPVKETALAHGIPVWQPVRVKEEDFLLQLEDLAPDVIVVAAFGQILPERILNLPPYGCINVHASLLPKYRGAAPIQWAVIDGEKETGITIMYMEKGLDTGDMIKKASVAIDPKETGASLHDKLAALGGPLLLEALTELEEGRADPQPQKEEDSTYARMLSKDLGKIDWSRDAASIERLVRGLNSWPSAYTSLGGKTLKLWDTDVAGPQEAGLPAESEDSMRSAGMTPGTVAAVTKNAIYVVTGKGLLRINELQLQGKKRMPVSAFLRGYHVEPGIVLGA